MIFYLVETEQSLVDLRRLPKRELAETLVDRLAFFTAADAAEAVASANNRQLLVARLRASTVRIDVGYKICTLKSLAWSDLDLRAIAPELEVHEKDRSAGFLSLSRQQWWALDSSDYAVVLGCPIFTTLSAACRAYPALDVVRLEALAITTNDGRVATCSSVSSVSRLYAPVHLVDEADASKAWAAGSEADTCVNEPTGSVPSSEPVESVPSEFQYVSDVIFTREHDQLELKIFKNDFRPVVSEMLRGIVDEAIRDLCRDRKTPEPSSQAELHSADAPPCGVWVDYQNSLIELYTHGEDGGTGPQVATMFTENLEGPTLADDMERCRRLAVTMANAGQMRRALEKIASGKLSQELVLKLASDSLASIHRTKHWQPHK